jgi:hypothetical protein
VVWDAIPQRELWISVPFYRLQTEYPRLTPAIVYFPPGYGDENLSSMRANLSCSKYVVSSPINAYYYTQMIGDARQPPTLLASSSFSGLAVIGETSMHSSYRRLLVLTMF